MTNTKVDFQTEANNYYLSRFADIRELLDSDSDDATEQLQEMPLSIELIAVHPNYEACEWAILIGTGGPADRVLVQTDMGGEIDNATYQCQDWFQPWTAASNQDRELVEQFARVFYFGTVSVNIDS
jgi:hypothetical protein